MSILLLGSLNASAQIQMTAEPDTNIMKLGDQQTILLTITADPSIEVGNIHLDSVTKIPGFEVINQSSWELQKGQNSQILIKKILFTAFEPGTFKFPPVVYDYNYNNEDRQGASRSFEIKVLPVDSNQPNLEPNKGIVLEPKNWRDYVYWMIGGLILLLVVLVFFYFYKKRKASKNIKIEVLKPDPKVVALVALNHLQSSPLPDSDDYKIFQTELSQIVRTYIAEQLKIKALENTSSSVIRQLHYRKIEGALVEDVNNALNIADMVKFARAETRSSIHRQYIEKMKHFVEITGTESSSSSKALD